MAKRRSDLASDGRSLQWKNVKGWRRHRAKLRGFHTPEGIIPRTWHDCETALLRAAELSQVAGLLTQARSIRGCVVYLRGILALDEHKRIDIESPDAND